MARPATRGSFGEHPERETVRVVGGPRDGDADSYYDLADYPDMATPGGRYVFAGHGDRAELLYVFRHDHSRGDEPSR
jgi:hypothetical protein